MYFSAGILCYVVVLSAGSAAPDRADALDATAAPSPVPHLPSADMQHPEERTSATKSTVLVTHAGETVQMPSLEITASEHKPKIREAEASASEVVSHTTTDYESKPKARASVPRGLPGIGMLVSEVSEEIGQVRQGLSRMEDPNGDGKIYRGGNMQALHIASLGIFPLVLCCALTSKPKDAKEAALNSLPEPSPVRPM
eukprot:gnl/TRDRNA2_/TRDRNA2_180458_c0_seq1.p1 gnl/TRDRNA2_/TRDRNA2_180458_c0~~gnl/TRDRNA2_/TRDRNA2_180458_c0_seq1.p1  ORF type:complete len:226 (+),score=27.47 gnl/TRDRNA2_/TRDRNA2_180458_c0_seq1:87-680(+)